MSEQGMVEIPRYKCHKEVRATKITGISAPDFQDFAQLEFGIIGGYKNVSRDWMAKHKPECGGYFVIYEDGYESFSPGKAFEEGYTAI